MKRERSNGQNAFIFPRTCVIYSKIAKSDVYRVFSWNRKQYAGDMAHSPTFYKTSGSHGDKSQNVEHSLLIHSFLISENPSPACQIDAKRNQPRATRNPKTCSAYENIRNDNYSYRTQHRRKPFNGTKIDFLTETKKSKALKRLKK